ncbi:MAG: PQQ-dependent sugar dehydrogenase [Tepidisphaeraceae bacterium]
MWDGKLTGPSVGMEALEVRRHFAANLPSGFREVQVVTGLPEVTSMDFSPDGRLFITELDGSVRVVKNGQKLATPFLQLNVDRYNNRGLIGIEFDPNFAVNRYVYVFYSTPDPSNPDVVDNNSVNRVSRFRASNTNKDVYETGSEVVLLNNIPNDLGGHNGGAMHFGKDGMLYVTTGETGISTYAQDLNSLAGKILRLNVKNYPNSIIPSDNPFVGQSGRRPEIWAYGLRHPYTAAIHPVTGQYFANDVGSDKWEEINEIQKGKNYGWNKVEGNSSNSAYKNPIYQYSHNGSGAAIVGSTFYTANQFPTSYQDQYFFADFEDGWVKVLNPATKAVTNFATNLKAPVDLDVGPDGALYYLAYNDRYSTTANRSVYKFEYVGEGNRAPSAEYAVNPTSGTAPLAVTFDASESSDPDGDPLTYFWDFGDGATSTEMIVTHTYESAGVFQPTLVATDSGGLFDHDTLPTINANNSVPTGTITLPATGTTYRAGDTIAFAGAGADPEDGTLGNSSFSWSVRLFHNTHAHPFLTFNNTQADSFTIPNPPDEVEANQWYRIMLTVTDSAGGTHSSFVDVTPLTSVVTLGTNVPGLNVELDGQAVPDGTAFTGVENAIRTIGAAAIQVLDGRWYQFESWSDGGAAQHPINTPIDDGSYTANYVEIPVPESATIPASGDTYVRDGASASLNFGDGIELIAKKSPTAGNSREVFIKFDTTGALASGLAKVRLFGQLGNLTGAVKDVPVGIYPVSDTSWDEEALTYSTRPTAGSLIATTTIRQGAGQWYEWDVSNYVNAEKAAGREVVGFVLRGTTNTDPMAVFGSDESANRPELVLAPRPPSQDVLLAPTADGTVRNGTHGNTNFGNDFTLDAKKSSTSGNTREAYLKFDLAAVATISTAKLRLRGWLTNVIDSTSPVVGIYSAANTSWTESGLTYNNRPATGGAALATRTISGSAGAWYEFDLTAFLQAEKAAGRNEVTLVIKTQSNSNPMAQFNSGEASTNGPELFVQT